MNRRFVIASLACLPFTANAQSLASVGTMLKDPLMKTLTSQLGVTENQAQGGVGAYLSLLQEKLAKGDFDKIAALVPGASKYMDMAKQLGAVTGPLNNLAGLNGSLGKLGMNAETVSKFTPTVTNLLGKAGGDSVQTMLASALK